MEIAQLAGTKRECESACSVVPSKRSRSDILSTSHGDVARPMPAGLEYALASHLPYKTGSPSLEQLAEISTLSSYIAPPGAPVDKECQPKSLAPCPAAAPCSDPQCEDVLPCLEPVDWCKTLECLGEICYDRDCHFEHHQEELCCDEPCPDGDQCQSPCYSQECNVPTCGSPCPESQAGHPHYADADSQTTDGYFESAALACGCVDPQCLEITGHWHCHDPHHAHHYDFADDVGRDSHMQQMISGARCNADSQNLAFYGSQSYRHNANMFNAQDPFLALLEQSNASGFDSQMYSGNYSAIEPPATPALTNASSATPATTGSGSSYHTSQPLETDLSCHWSFASHDAPASLHVCGQQFETAEELHKHVEKAHIEGLPREDAAGNGFYCRWEGCDRYLCRSFQARPKLKRHMQTHTLFKPFICRQCGVQMKTKDAMEKHERTHTGERPYRCQVAGCASTFATSTELKTHMVVHSGEKPHQCPICAECFADSSNLSKHKKTHFVGMYKCPDCGARMKRWDQMRRHIVTQNHATMLMEDKRAQHEYKARMEREFRELPDAEKALGFSAGSDKGSGKGYAHTSFRGRLGVAGIS